MNQSHGEHLSVAKTLYQLDFYLRILDLPFTVRDLYEAAYKRRRGARYDDRWLDTLEDNPEVAESIHEPFTAQTIIDTLMRTGHTPIVMALMREIRRRRIGFSQAYLREAPRRRP
ncbi:MAG: hypothetical protein IRZ10_03380 [Thermoflavifilum sp.]|nr:hypothetical protein [Thermoflavifilum sp.]MCL6513438.1 hypothetical protein [Alicyclobacillus sp.]